MGKGKGMFVSLRQTCIALILVLEKLVRIAQGAVPFLFPLLLMPVYKVAHHGDIHRHPKSFKKLIIFLIKERSTGVAFFP